MSLDKLQQLVSSVAQAIESNKQFAIPFLSTKIARALEDAPQDQTLGLLQRVLDKMAENNKTFIKKADLQSLYNKLYVFGTTANEVLSEELGAPADPQLTMYARPDAESKQSFDFKPQDNILSTALSHSFDHLSPVKAFTSDVAERAIKLVKNALDATNLKPSRLSLNHGNERFLIVQADYDTPKGLTSFLIPVEIYDNKVLHPEVLVSNAGPTELNHSNIKAYLTKFAGVKAKFGSADLLNALTDAIVGKETPEVSDTELALTKLNASRQDSYGSLDNQILGQTISKVAEQDVQLPKYDEFESFEKQFSTPHGLASWEFGNLVNVARNHIDRELLSFGYRNSQIAVSNSDKDSVSFNVSLNAGKTAFTVPVKIKEGKIQKPTLLLCNGNIGSFDKSGVSSLMNAGISDHKAASNASVMAMLKNSEVIDSLRSAIAMNDYSTAEEALNVLAHNNDATAYATGLDLYMRSLAAQSMEKTASQESKCSKLIKTAVSEHPICSHTGLPAHKVYQDKDGNCLPKYRQSMSETYEGASFLNAKVLI